jgi:hypothetical protein
MPGKQLQIIVSAVDQATGPMRAVQQQAVKLGIDVDQAGERGRGGLLKIITAADAGRAKILAMTAVVSTLGVALFGLAARAGAGVFDQTLNELDNIGKSARRLGFEVEELSGLRYVAQQANVEWSSFAGAIATAEKNLSQYAVFGSGRAKEVVEALGLNLKDQNGELRAMRDLLPEIADRINQLPTEQRIQVAQRLFGSNDVLQVFELGSQGIRDTIAEAATLGVQFTERQTRAAEEYGDSVDRISAAWFGVKAAVAGAAAPAVTEFLNEAAARLATLPDTVRGIVDQLRSDRPDPALAEAFNAGVTVLVRGGVEAGRLLAVTAVEGTIAGVRAAAPTLSDVFRDIVGPVFNEIPGLPSIDLSPKFQAATATAELEEFRRVLRNRQDLDNLRNRQGQPGVNSAELAAIRSQIESIERGGLDLPAVGNRSFTDLRAAEASVKQLQIAAAGIDRERAAGLARAFQDAGAAIEEQLGKATDRLLPDIERMESALARLQQTGENIRLGEAGQLGPVFGPEWEEVGSDLLVVGEQVRGLNADLGETAEESKTAAKSLKQALDVFDVIGRAGSLQARLQSAQGMNAARIGCGC